MSPVSKLRDSISIARSFARAMMGKDAQTRYQARYGLVRRAAVHWGFELYNSNLVWHLDEDYWRAWKEFPESDRCIQDRKYVVYSMARSVRDLPGDTAECGVFRGASSFLICLATGDRDGRQHHIFDSFEGLSEPNKTHDTPAYDYTYQWAKHDLSVPLETVKQNLSRFKHVHYHRGWIPERFGDVSDRQFAFVHVDVDLHEPTRDSLVYFYERLVPGGVLLCDDYGSAACPGAKQAFDELIADKPEQSVIHLPTGQGFIIKRGPSVRVARGDTRKSNEQSRAS